MYKALTFVSASDASMTKLITDVLIRIANGVSQESVRHSMFVAFRRLCTDSEALIYRCEQALSATDLAYSIIQSNTSTPADYDAEVIRVKSVKAMPANKVGLWDFHEMDQIPPYAYDLVDAKQLNFSVQLFDIRQYDGGILQTDSVLTTPIADGEFVKEFVHDYPDALVYATCVELLSQAGRPWFNGDLLQYYESRYQHELSLIYNKTDTGNKNCGVDAEG